MLAGSLIYFTDSHLTDEASVDRRYKFKYSGSRFYSEAEDNIDEAVAPTTDEESPLGEATPTNAYYLIEVLQTVIGKWDVRVTGYGANPVGASAEPSSYLIG